jgi:hypothetical protein
MLALVPDPAPARGPTISFCSHCGARPTADTDSRVCEDCGFGLLLKAGGDAAPPVGGAFMVLDSSLSICALSRAAESLLSMHETEAVHRHVTELVVPADAEAQGGDNLAVAVMWAARGDEGTQAVTLRPTNTFGIRLKATIGACGPARAALVVFD